MPTERAEPAWAQQRTCPFDSEQTPKLTAAWNFSSERLHRLTDVLRLAALNRKVACIAVSGSLARMESHPDSDIDLLLVIDDRESKLTDGERADIYQATWQIIESAFPDTPPRPMAGGIFSVPVSWASLTHPASRGIVDEAIVPYGQRMQLLLDSQPVYGSSGLSELQSDILKWHADSPVTKLFEGEGQFHWLTQEIHRYWRCIQARACWLFAETPGRSVHTNVKLRSSRLLLISTFLNAIRQTTAASLDPASCEAALLTECRRTPMERLVNALPLEEFRSVAIAYENAWTFARQHERPVATSLPTDLRQSLAEIQRCISGLAWR